MVRLMKSFNWENATQATQFTAAKVGASAGGADASTAYTDKMIGILQDDPKQNQEGQVCMLGICKAKLGGSVTIGDKLAPTTNGVLITDNTSGHNYLAIASFSGGSSGDIIYVFVCPGSNG